MPNLAVLTSWSTALRPAAFFVPAIAGFLTFVCDFAALAAICFCLTWAVAVSVPAFMFRLFFLPVPGSVLVHRSFLLNQELDRFQGSHCNIVAIAHVPEMAEIIMPSATNADRNSQLTLIVERAMPSRISNPAVNLTCLSIDQIFSRPFSQGRPQLFETSTGLPSGFIDCMMYL